ncbi:hypothetical protein FIU89_21170 (plasmid) [Roseovarius sp. THAF27]|nr:hypothetical protein FIU89_21170 [Roseovarius sp. THAF27]QFT99686.1 hypothetical protein FIU85_20380 [Roseovarius sp. THAF8]
MKHAPIDLWSFESRVEFWLLKSLSAGVTSFSSLLAELPGVYPTAAMAGIRRLVKSGRISVEMGRKLALQARVASSPTSTYAELPPPHPLDFEWRFNQETSEALASRAVIPSARRFGRTLCLGVPTVALAAIKLGLGQHADFLGEANEISTAVSEHARRRASSLSTHFGSSRASSASYASVVLDPPWYDDCLHEMIPLAASACQHNGTVFVVAAPFGSRRSAIDHRANLISIAEQCGLVLANQVPAFARYQTPFFEANALKAAGLAVPGDWRTADLLEFRKAGVGSSLPLKARTRPRPWHELSVGRMRLFIDVSQPDEHGGDVTLNSIVAGDVLPTVSRRDGRRTRANVWTSGNRIFRCNRPNELVAALEGDLLALPEFYHRDPCRPYYHRNFQRYATLKFHLQKLSAKELQEEKEHFGGNSGAARRIASRTQREVAFAQLLGSAPRRDPLQPFGQ